MLRNASISGTDHSSNDYVKELTDNDQEKNFFNVPTRDPITSFYPDDRAAPLDLQERRMREAFKLIDKSSQKYTSFKDLQDMLQGQIIEKRQNAHDHGELNKKRSSYGQDLQTAKKKVNQYRHKF